MRHFLFLATLLPFLAGCGEHPLSCERLNGLQSDVSLQTCAASGSLNGDNAVDVSLKGGSTLPIDALPDLYSRATFENGVTLAIVDSLATFRGGGAGLETAPVGAAGDAAAAPVGDRFALALSDGRLSIRSRSSAAVIEQPIEIEVEIFGDVPIRETVPMSFSADGTRLAVVEASRKAFVLDTETGARVWESTLVADGKKVSFSSDGSRIAVSLDDNSVCVWTLATAGAPTCWAHRRKVADAAFSPDGSHLIVWLHEATGSRRENIYRPNSPVATSDPTKTRTVRTTTPPAVVVWRLP